MPADRCPTCGSDDPKKVTHEFPANHFTNCNDSFHGQPGPPTIVYIIVDEAWKPNPGQIHFIGDDCKPDGHRMEWRDQENPPYGEPMPEQPATESALEKGE